MLRDKDSLLGGGGEGRESVGDLFASKPKRIRSLARSFSILYFLLVILFIFPLFTGELIGERGREEEVYKEIKKWIPQNPRLLDIFGKKHHTIHGREDNVMQLATSLCISNTK